MNIGELNLELQVSTCSSCYNLVIEDHSYYLENPEKPQIEIVPPGFTSPFIFEFSAQKTNIFNSYSFGLSTAGSLSELPDGLYTITYRICPHDELYTKLYYSRTCEIRCSWEKKFLSIFSNCYEPTPSVLEKLKEIDALIIASELAAKNCDPSLSIAFLRKANDLLTNLTCE